MPILLADTFSASPDFGADTIELSLAMILKPSSAKPNCSPTFERGGASSLFSFFGLGRGGQKVRYFPLRRPIEAMGKWDGGEIRFIRGGGQETKTNLHF